LPGAKRDSTSRPASFASLKAAKVGGSARFHDLRHADATYALAAGLSAHAVAALLGHSDAGLVLRRYGHALPNELAGANDALSAFRRSRGLGLHHDCTTTVQVGPQMA
jgi:integrase